MELVFYLIHGFCVVHLWGEVGHSEIYEMGLIINAKVSQFINNMD